MTMRMPMLVMVVVVAVVVISQSSAQLVHIGNPRLKNLIIVALAWVHASLLRLGPEISVLKHR